MSRVPNVLILGDHGSQLSSLAERIRDLGFRAIRAKTPLDAIALSQERGFRYAVALIEPDLASLDLASALADLRSRTGSHDVIFLATGDEPASGVRARLRGGGVSQALWQPISDHVLRFHVNRAARHDPAASLREEQRVPTDWISRVTVAGRAKQASVYSLSGGGAFLATERPSMRGAEVAIDLPLPEGTLNLLGRVLYTNVPGNRQRAQLPVGMGVLFVRTPPSDHAAISDTVARVAARFSV